MIIDFDTKSTSVLCGSIFVFASRTIIVFDPSFYFKFKLNSHKEYKIYRSSPNFI